MNPVKALQPSVDRVGAASITPNLGRHKVEGDSHNQGWNLPAVSGNFVLTVGDQLARHTAWCDLRWRQKKAGVNRTAILSLA